jgi:membrane-associated phospholipid phosphatase
MRWLPRAMLVFALLCAQPAPARGDEPPPGDGRDAHRLHWDFPTFRLWQFVAIGLQTAGNLYIELVDVPSAGEHWRSPLPLDRPIRDGLVAQSEAGKKNARTIADTIWYATEYYVVVVDSLLVPLAFDGFNTRVASQMTLINWQALGLSGILTRIAHHTVPRARPITYGCSEEPGAEFPCQPSGPGFFSGHVAMATTGAALSCAHHAAMPLYGSGPAGGITCGLLATGSVTVGLMRIVADKHWFTDVLVGHIVGASVGLGLPWFLHYQHRITPDMSALGVSDVVWLPAATPDGGSLSLIGFF